jgi:hypothetical protein
MCEVPDLIPHEEGPKSRSGFDISRCAAYAASVYVSRTLRVAMESQFLADMVLPFWGYGSRNWNGTDGRFSLVPEVSPNGCRYINGPRPG